VHREDVLLVAALQLAQAALHINDAQLGQKIIASQKAAV
jgi:hypothetical protein